MVKWGRFLRAVAVVCAFLAQVSGARTFSEKYYKNISVGIAGGNGGVRMLPPFGAGLWLIPARGGAEILVSGADDSQPYLRFGCSDSPDWGIFHSPDGKFGISISAPQPVRGAGGEPPSETAEFFAEVPAYSELAQYRNLAPVSRGFRVKAGVYPRAEMSDGSGGEKSLKIDFGREVEIGRLAVRGAEGSAGGEILTSFKLEFSGAEPMPVSFKEADGARVFDFPKRRVSVVKISFADSPANRSAARGMEVWGRDVLPFEAFGEGGRKLPFEMAAAALRRPRNKTLNRWTWRMLEEIYPVESDWLMRDAGFDLSELPEGAEGRAEFFARALPQGVEIRRRRFGEVRGIPPCGESVRGGGG